MKLLKHIVALALALLMSQAAIAVHDVHCLGEEHDQSCEVYFVQDHGASSDDSDNPLERNSYAEKPDGFAVLISPNVFNFLYLTRAPPNHF